MGDLLGSPRVAPSFCRFSRHRSIWALIFLIFLSGCKDLEKISPLIYWSPEADLRATIYDDFKSKHERINRKRRAKLTGAIIPALMHRIPSELRSLACLGKSSTRMGDLQGSPRVAPSFCCFSRPRSIWALIFLIFSSGCEDLEKISPLIYCSPETDLRASIYDDFKSKHERMNRKRREELMGAIIQAVMHRIP